MHSVDRYEVTLTYPTNYPHCVAIMLAIYIYPNVFNATTSNTYSPYTPTTNPLRTQYLSHYRWSNRRRRTWRKRTALVNQAIRGL
jgi:hypothetical protein